MKRVKHPAVAMARNPAFVKVSVVESPPAPVTARDGYANHVTHTPNECPTSDHRKKVHKGRAHARITVTTLWGNGRTSKSYIDLSKCQFCGHEWRQEWMPGLI